MEYLHKFIYFVGHLNESLGTMIATYGTTTYLILFAIIFCETGFVVTPFLPGDSLLFTAGSFAAKVVDPKTGATALSLGWLLLLLSLAAIIGDSLNYWIGYFFGKGLLRSGIIKPKHVERTHKFYDKYGKKAIILARFVPVVRTFNPFVAGFGRMSYLVFIAYDVFGGILWVTLMTVSGYYFGTLAWVQKHFEAVVVAIVVISILPMVIEYWAHRREQARALKADTGAAALPEEE